MARRLTTARDGHGTLPRRGLGAPLWGALFPPDWPARELAARREDVVVVLLLPSFFAFTGNADRGRSDRRNTRLMALIALAFDLEIGLLDSLRCGATI